MIRLRLALAAAVLGTLALGAIAYDLRAFLPYPTNYITRLLWLRGWSSQGYYAFNCSGLIADAHGEPFMTERDFFAVRGHLRLVAEVSDRSKINEAALLPGDVAAFAGPSGTGQHVAAFVKPGLWIDGDSRRGFVATYRLADKPANDQWFSGAVRIVRWTSPAGKASPRFFEQEQAAIMAE